MRRKKVWDNLPKVDVYKPNLDAFYKFMYERHMIWYKRFVLKQLPPWTKDKILRDHKFTNVYRELDRGTIFYTEFVDQLKNGNHWNLESLIWYTVMYRLLNRVDTFKVIGWPSFMFWKEQNRKHLKQTLQKIHDSGAPVFTSAHLTLPTHEIGKTKIEKYVEVLDSLYKMLFEITRKVRECTSLESLFKIFKTIPCVGHFISYEICCDLMLVGAVPFHENDWVNPGPGAKGGIKLIYPNTSTYEEFQKKIMKLANEQGEHFERLGLEFPYLYDRTPLTLRSIEHSLCEFRKYKNMQVGMGKHRMKYNWQEVSQQLLRFPR